MVIPMLPFPRPILCAAALRLCCWSLTVAVAELDDPAVLDGSLEGVSVVRGGNANVVDVEVEVVAGATTAVGVTGDVDTVAEEVGCRVGDGAFPPVVKLLTLEEEPWWACRCRGL
jgi:hypothetical protein